MPPTGRALTEIAANSGSDRIFADHRHTYRHSALGPSGRLQEPLALELLLADAVCFIPVQFGEPEPAVSQSDSSNAFHLPPAALLDPVETASLADPLAPPH